MKNNDWKDRLNVVYSTNPDFNYDMDDDQEQVTLDKNKQNLRVSLDRKNRVDALKNTAFVKILRPDFHKLSHFSHFFQKST